MSGPMTMLAPTTRLTISARPGEAAAMSKVSSSSLMVHYSIVASTQTRNTESSSLINSDEQQLIALEFAKVILLLFCSVWLHEPGGWVMARRRRAFIAQKHASHRSCFPDGFVHLLLTVGTLMRKKNLR